MLIKFLFFLNFVMSPWLILASVSKARFESFYELIKIRVDDTRFYMPSFAKLARSFAELTLMLWATLSAADCLYKAFGLNTEL